MSADAATAAPTKRGRKAWLIAVAVVVAVVTIALLTNAPKPEPVKVWFVHSTNYFGKHGLVFEVSNGQPEGIRLLSCAAVGSVAQAKRQAGFRFAHAWMETAGAGASNFTFTLEAPSEDVPFYVAWWFDDVNTPRTRWGETSDRVLQLLSRPRHAGCSRAFLPFV